MRIWKALRSVMLASALTSGCARDLVLDFGTGDSVRIAGAADAFDCADPAYAEVAKTVIANLHFADGTLKQLCRDATRPPPKGPAVPQIRGEIRTVPPDKPAYEAKP